MEKKVILKLDRDLKQGMKGIQISLISLIILAIFLFFFLALTSGFLYAIKVAFEAPNSETDFLALFAGIIIFIAIPFILSINIKKFKES